MLFDFRLVKVLVTCKSFLIVFAVLDDEDSSNITAGSIVTVTVTLTRKRMAVRNAYMWFNLAEH